MIIVSFPRNECVRDHVERTLEIIKELEVDYSSTKSISLNFSEVKWFLPCSMILLSNKVRELMARGAGFVQYVRPINEKAREHMEKIGFPLGDKKDGGSYISIKHISRNQNKKDLVNERVNEMTSSLKELVPEEFGQSVIYILSEMSDNIDQHSNFQFASLMAQYFPQKGILDIAVFDNGLTIPGVYEKNNLKFNYDVKPGHSKLWCPVCENIQFLHSKRLHFEFIAFKTLGFDWSCSSCRDVDVRGLVRNLRKETIV